MKGITIQGIKSVIKSKTLNKQEKIKLLFKAIAETILGSYKFIIKLPFMIIGLIFALLFMITSYLVQLFELLEGFMSSIYHWLEDKLPDIVFTKKDKAREKLINELTNKTYKVV